jgi:hypothetical protein
MNRRTILSASTAFVGLAMAGLYRTRRTGAAMRSASNVHYRVVQSDADWRKLLSPAAYAVFFTALARGSGRDLQLRRLRPAALLIGGDI